MTSLADDTAHVESLSALSRFRAGLYACLPRRADSLFELCDAMLCADSPVTSLPELTLLAEHQRGHGAMYGRPQPRPPRYRPTALVPGRASAAPSGRRAHRAGRGRLARMHPRLSHRGSWPDHEGELPIVEGALVRLQVERLPGDGDPKPVWLWSSTTEVDAEHVDRLWQAFLRGFALEHTFRLFKQTRGWTCQGPLARGGRSVDVVGDRRSHPAATGPPAR